MADCTEYISLQSLDLEPLTNLNSFSNGKLAINYIVSQCFENSRNIVK